MCNAINVGVAGDEAECTETCSFNVPVRETNELYEIIVKVQLSLIQSTFVCVQQTQDEGDLVELAKV